MNSSQDMSDVIRRAMYKVWPYEKVIAEREQSLPQRWGKIRIETLYWIVSSDDEEERAFALYALGFCASTEARPLLVSFAQSQTRYERWAALRTLGFHYEEDFLEPLQHLLIERLDAYPTDAPLEEQIYAAWAIYPRSQWRQEVGPERVLAWERLLEKESDYSTFLIYRFYLLQFLTQWRGEALIPTLQQALQTVQQIDATLPAVTRNNFLGYEFFLQYHYHLAFRLGNLGAFSVLKACEQSTASWRLLLAYFLMGALQKPEDMVPILYQDGLQYEPEKSALLRMMERYTDWTREEQEAYLAQLKKDVLFPFLSEVQFAKDDTVKRDNREAYDDDEPPW